MQLVIKADDYEILLNEYLTLLTITMLKEIISEAYKSDQFFLNILISGVKYLNTS